MMKLQSIILASLLSVSCLCANEWGYDAEHGPKKWGELNPDFKECAVGKTQTPINIVTKDVKQVKKNELSLNYKSDSKDIVNNGHSIQVNFTKSGEITFKGTKYKLLQTHFHTPAENHVDDKVYPLEMHLVHQSDDGKLLVVGVFFEEGKNNAELQKIIAAAPKEAGKTANLKNIKVSAIIPQSKAYYAFDGSLTTPPCTANVQWVVLKNVAQATKQQIQDLHEVLHNNARDIQELNGRVIENAN